MGAGRNIENEILEKVGVCQKKKGGIDADTKAVLMRRG